jgi:Protein of unknown function (DUF3179)
VYGRTVKGEVLTFGHEGVLYRRSFVMYDKQSDSKWLHVTGEALIGPKAGQKLSFMPSEITTWADWSRRYPLGLALTGDKARGFMGSFTLKGKLKDYGLSLGEGSAVKLIRFTLLEQVPVLNTRLSKLPLVAVFDPTTSRAVAWSRRLGERTLQFEFVQGGKYPQMRDSETGSLWDRMQGTCLAGELAGKQLDPVLATAWLGKRWKGFFPKGEIMGLPEIKK